MFNQHKRTQVRWWRTISCRCCSSFERMDDAQQTNCHGCWLDAGAGEGWTAAAAGRRAARSLPVGGAGWGGVVPVRVSAESSGCRGKLPEKRAACT